MEVISLNKENFKKNSISVALEQMKSYIFVNYPSGTTRNLYLRFIKQFEDYLQENLKKDGQDLIKSFYEETVGRPAFQKPSRVGLRLRARPILILNDIFNGKQPKRKYCYERYEILAPVFVPEMEQYILRMTSEGASAGTVHTRSGRIKLFFNFLHTNHCDSLKDLSPDILLSFIQSLGSQYSSQGSASILYTLRHFFKAPKIKSTIPFDPMLFLNDIHSKKHERLPSVYTTKEIEAVMKVVDRTIKSGKMIYLMMLLAAVYGLRACDIREFKLSSIHWSSEEIALVQKKTNKPVRLPLTTEVKFAILDYLRNVRVESDDPHLFLRIRAPHTPYGEFCHFSAKVAVFFEKANIDTSGKHCGLHSLRHSLATELTSKDVPMNEVANILGHTTVAATKQYIWSDFINLKRAALEVSMYVE